MKSTNIITVQIVSFILILLTANNLLEDVSATILFTLSFCTFAHCALYINKHQKELLREINRRYAERKAIQ
jgi:uncharacterized membrane protein